MEDSELKNNMIEMEAFYRTSTLCIDAILNGTNFYWDSKPIEYIQSSGQEYIVTDYFPNQNTKIYIEMEITSLPTDNNIYLYGSRKAEDEKAFALGFKDHWIHNYNIDYKDDQGNIEKDTKYIIEHDYKGIFVNKTRYYETMKRTFTSPNPLVIFALDEDEIISNNCSIKLYKLIIKELNTIVKEYRPMIDKDNKVCLYEKLSNTYLYNEGEGEFIAGGVI